MSTETIERSATISPDGVYRYSLGRWWDRALRPLPFIMLNPSTADADLDDPTIRRCISFARREGYGGIGVCNLYAYRSTDPKALLTAGCDVVGPNNNELLRTVLRWAQEVSVPVVAAWGANAKPDRVAWLLEQDGAANLRCLGVTKAGAPRHPLYVKGDAPLIPWGSA